MERIDTDVTRTTVMIEGAEYGVAENTVAVTQALMKARRRCKGKMEYRLWKAQLRILLGKAAVKRLFAQGGKENIDRMQRIHAGVCRAFERNAAQVEQRQAQERAEAWAALAAALAPVNQLLERLEDAGTPLIRRGDTGEK